MKGVFGGGTLGGGSDATSIRFATISRVGTRTIDDVPAIAKGDQGHGLCIANRVQCTAGVVSRAAIAIGRNGTQAIRQ